MLFFQKNRTLVLLLILVSSCGDDPIIPLLENDEVVVDLHVVDSRSFNVTIQTQAAYGCNPAISQQSALARSTLEVIIKGVAEGDGSCNQRARGKEVQVRNYGLNVFSIALNYRRETDVFVLERSNSQAPWVLTSDSRGSFSRFVGVTN